MMLVVCRSLVSPDAAQWGDIVFIQFFFHIQAWALLDAPLGRLSPAAIAVCVATFAVGYAVFRMCNKQKHDFKKDKRKKIWGKEPQAIEGKLLVSGLWGLSPRTRLSVQGGPVTSTTSATSSWPSHSASPAHGRRHSPSSCAAGMASLTR